MRTPSFTKSLLLLVAFSGIVALAGCQTMQSVLRPEGPAAGRIATLTWVVLITFCVIAIVLWGMLIWLAMRRRGSLAEHEPWNSGGGQSWILVGGFAIPFVVLSCLFVYGIESMSAFPIHDGKVRPEIVVVGHQFWWEVRYVGGPLQTHFTTANEIHIPAGRAVDIELRSADVIHSFWVPALHGKVDLIPGQPNYIRVEANKPGRFFGQCAEYCGEQHAHMLLLVVAQEENEYQAWLNQQLQPAAEPTTEVARHGRDVFMSAACAFCHMIRGTEAQGRVAPDLTHIGSRWGIAANSFKNNEANMEAWFTHAQSLKQGSEMPNLTAFNGADSRALAQFLEQLQ